MIAIVMFVSSQALAGSESDGGRIQGRVTLKENQKHPVVVFVAGLKGTRGVTGERPTVDQKGKAFVPRILPIVVGTTVEFRNSDPFKHNVFSPDGERYNLGTWEAGKSRSHTFRRPGIFRQLCNIHPEMFSYIVVLETPAFALTDAEGKFEIAGIPPGPHTLRFWGEKLTAAQLARNVEVAVSREGTTPVVVDLAR